MKFWIKFSFFILVCATLIFLMKSPIFQVKTYEVEGNSYYSDDEILHMGNCKTGGNIFIGVDTGEIKKRLKRDSYMKNISIKRKLPNTIVIELDERRQVAAAVYGSKFIVIDNEGTVLRRTSVEPELTILRGMTISKLNIGEPIEMEQKVLMRQTMEILEAASKNDMYFKALTVSKKGIDAYVLNNLICEGSFEHLKDSIETKNLQLVISELFKKKIERGTITISGDNYISFTPKLD